MIKYFFDIVCFNESMKNWEVVFSIQFVVLLGFVLAYNKHLVSWFDSVDKVI